MSSIDKCKGIYKYNVIFEYDAKKQYSVYGVFFVICIDKVEL